MSMDSRSCSEGLIGKAIVGKLPADQLDADLLWGEYSKAVPLLLQGNVNRAELRGVIGHDLMNAALYSEERMPDNEIQDNLDQLPQLVRKEKEAKRLGHLSEGWLNGGADPQQLLDIYNANQHALNDTETTMSGLLEKWGAHRDFIWRPWLAQGVFHVIGAEHGHGKSTLTAALIKIITCGKALPDGTEPGIRGTVFLGETEYRLARLLRLLDRWGVPSERLDLPETRGGSIDLMRPDSQGWSELQKALNKPKVVAVFIDTLTGALGTRENDPIVKEVAMRLGRMATESGKAIVSTHHLNQIPPGAQRRKTVIPSDFRGHGGVVDNPPILIGLLKPNPNEATRLLIDVKNGETDTQEEDMAFQIDVSRDGTIDTGVERPKAPTQASVGEKCAVDMRAILANSAQPVQDARAVLFQKGHSSYAIRSARELIGVEEFQEGLNSKSRSSHKWRLPPQFER